MTLLEKLKVLFSGTKSTIYLVYFGILRKDQGFEVSEVSEYSKLTKGALYYSLRKLLLLDMFIVKSYGKYNRFILKRPYVFFHLLDHEPSDPDLNIKTLS